MANINNLTIEELKRVSSNMIIESADEIDGVFVQAITVVIKTSEGEIYKTMDFTSKLS